MHVGEAVAMVVAESLMPRPLDAAELVAVEYEELPAVIDAREALKPEAPQLFDDIPQNLALDWPGPDRRSGQCRSGRRDHANRRRMSRA